MDRRLAGTARAGMMLVAWLLLAHVATGASLPHGLADHGGGSAGRAGDVSASASAEHAVVACSDSGACLVADRPSTPVDLTAGLAVVLVLAMLPATVVSVVAGHLRRVDPGPAPPSHLSAQVVLLI